MPPEEVSEILARAEAATSGPWYYDPVTGMHSSTAKNDCDEDAQICSGLWKYNADFIAHARTDLPRVCHALLEAWASDGETCPSCGRLGLYHGEGCGLWVGRDKLDTANARLEEAADLIRQARKAIHDCGIDECTYPPCALATALDIFGELQDRNVVRADQRSVLVRSWTRIIRERLEEARKDGYP